MEVVNEVYPSPDRDAGPVPEGPIVMMNLLRFKDQAVYPDGRETELTGREAYHLYAETALEVIAEHGGRTLLVGDVTNIRIGQVEDLWDEALLVEYPNREALAALGASDKWKTVAHHREAGLVGQLNIEVTHIPDFHSVTSPS